MDNMKKNNKRKSVKHLYNKDTGLPIMINLYVIKYIYYHIEKADLFIEEKKEGKKAKAHPIYQNELPMSRQRFDRINKGMRFEITTKEATSITETFGIDIKYFRRDNPVAFDIEGIDITDWKCFYNVHYNNEYNLSSNIDSDGCKKRAEIVEDTLKKLVKTDWDHRLGKDNPLFAVCYYFHYGKRSDRPNSIKILKEALKQLDYKEWDNENAESLKEARGLLNKHLGYVNSLITLDKLRNEK